MKQKAKTRLMVYRQGKPIPIGERYVSQSGNRTASDEWHRANLIEVGLCDTWEQAKAMCRAPIVAAVEVQ